MSVPPLPQKKWIFDANSDPPTYTRPLAGSELSMHRTWQATDGSGECCIGVDFTSPMRVGELKDRARRALDKLRFRYPIIACTVQDIVSPGWMYTPSADREAWLDLALVIEDRGSSLNTSEFIRSINLARLPYRDRDGTATFFRVYLLTTSKEGDHDRKEYGLYFHGIHSIINVGVALSALNLMCEWMGGNGMNVTVVPSEEWKNLPLDSTTALAGLSQGWERSGANPLQSFTKQITRPLSAGHRLPPRPVDTSEPLSHYMITLSESETATIVARARRLGISVSALFRAAHGLAQLRINPIPPRPDVYFPRALAAFYLEHDKKSPAEVDPFASFSMMPLHFSLARPLMDSIEKRTLMSSAKEIQQQLDKYQADPYLPDLSTAFSNHSPRGTPERFCGFQSLGVVENSLALQHGDISIHNMCLGLRVAALMNVHMWTMDSKLHFQVQGAAAWGEDCRSLLEETVRIGSLITRNAKL